MYVFDLFKMSWKALPSAINKNVIIPSFIASTVLCMVIYFVWFIVQILLANDMAFGDFNSVTPWLVILNIVLTLPACWGYATVASVIKAKNEGQDDSWRKHTSVGFKGVKFFVTYVLAVVVLFLGITILSSIGLIPLIGKPILAILAVPFYFASIVIILCTLGLSIGTFLFEVFTYQVTMMSLQVLKIKRFLSLKWLAVKLLILLQFKFQLQLWRFYL